MGKGNPKIASIGHTIHGNPTVRYDTGFSTAFFQINTCTFCYPFLLPILGLRSVFSIPMVQWSGSGRSPCNVPVTVS